MVWNQRKQIPIKFSRVQPRPSIFAGSLGSPGPPGPCPPSCSDGLWWDSASTAKSAILVISLGQCLSVQVQVRLVAKLSNVLVRLPHVFLQQICHRHTSGNDVSSYIVNTPFYTHWAFFCRTDTSAKSSSIVVSPSIAAASRPKWDKRTKRAPINV